MLPALPSIIDSRANEAIKEALKDFEYHKLEAIIRKQTDKMIEKRLRVVETSIYRKEMKEKMEEMSSYFEKTNANLQERMEETLKERTTLEEREEEIHELSINMEKMGDEMRDEIRDESQKYKDAFAILKANFEKFKEDVFMASIMGGGVLLLSIVTIIIVKLSLKPKTKKRKQKNRNRAYVIV